MKPVTDWKPSDVIDRDIVAVAQNLLPFQASTPALVSPFTPGTPNDFVVYHLTYHRVIRREVMHHVTGHSVIREALGDLVCHYRCALYLHATFAPRMFSVAEVDRCVHIYRLVLRKATDYEHINDAKVDVYWNQPYPKGCNYGTSMRSRRVIARSLLYMPKVRIPCYDVDRQEEEGWSDANVNYPAFTLKELLEDDTKYEVFLHFWNSVPGFEDVFQALRDVCPQLPRDIVHMIMCG